MLQLVNTTTKKVIFTKNSLEEIASEFRDLYRQKYAITTSLREWVEEAADDEILNEAYLYGFSLRDYKEPEDAESK